MVRDTIRRWAAAVAVSVSKQRKIFAFSAYKNIPITNDAREMRSTTLPKDHRTSADSHGLGTDHSKPLFVTLRLARYAARLRLTAPNDAVARNAASGGEYNP